MTDDDITRDVNLADALQRAGDAISDEQKAELSPTGVRYCQIRYEPKDQHFVDVIEWLWKERERERWQLRKWDYADGDAERVLGGLDEDSHFWVNGVLNYAGRVRLFGITHPLGVQALLKLASTIVSMPEHLLRSGMIESLPKPGLSSGNLE